MASVLAIVSKAVFEQTAKQKGGAALGAKLGIDRYSSTHKALSPLADGGALFAVTVRPPDEALWLVAVLESPTLKKDGWYASPSEIAITDVSALKSKLKFANGKGITAAPGALGMSLQTPRTLSDEDEALLRAAIGGKAKAAPPPKVEPKAEKKPKVTKTAEGPRKADGLDAVLAAVESGDGEAALLAAIAEWRTSRAPALADVIDAMSKQISGAPVENEREFTKLANKKDPRTLGRLLPAMRSFPVSFLPTAGAALELFPDDPRISIAAGDWIAEPPGTSTSIYPFWVRVFEMLGRSPDVRIVDKLRKRMKKECGGGVFWPKFKKGIEKTLAKIEASSVGSADEKVLAKIAARIPKLATVEESEPARVASNEPVPKVEGPPLTRAAIHLAHNRIQPAIDAMLECWRETRVPEVADAIDRATRLLPTWDQPLDALDVKKAHERWIEAFAEDPAGNLPKLLQYVCMGGSSEATHHVIELATLPEDPRIAQRLAEVASLVHISPEKAQYWRSLFEVIARTKDVRTCAPLRADFDDFKSEYWYHHKHGRRIAGAFVLDPSSAFSRWPLVLDVDARALFDAMLVQLEAAEARADRTEMRLLADVAADWKSDGPRLVYADWLSERGHPRGEFIVLDCKKEGERSKGEKERHKQLSVNMPYLMGALQEFVDDRELDRGFVVDAKIEWGAGTLSWRTLRGHPMLGMMTSLRFDSDMHLPFANDMAAVLMHRDLLRLGEVSDVPKALLDQVEPLVSERWARKGTKLVRK